MELRSESEGRQSASHQHHTDLHADSRSCNSARTDSSSTSSSTTRADLIGFKHPQGWRGYPHGLAQAAKGLGHPSSRTRRRLLVGERPGVLRQGEGYISHSPLGAGVGLRDAFDCEERQLGSRNVVKPPADVLGTRRLDSPRSSLLSRDADEATSPQGRLAPLRGPGARTTRQGGRGPAASPTRVPPAAAPAAGQGGAGHDALHPQDRRAQAGGGGSLGVEGDEGQ
mmetsp:Transcript_44269/g.139659  ORF Transcript_44269/g.139659 Transcript_44269/m.139659 type:complete len:226 (+) Transcript_44269:845-1522(+)